MKEHEFSQFGAFPAGSSTPALNPAEGHVHEPGHVPECSLWFPGEEGGNVFRTKVKTALKSSIISSLSSQPPSDVPPPRVFATWNEQPLTQHLPQTGPALICTGSRLELLKLGRDFL